MHEPLDLPDFHNVRKTSFEKRAALGAADDVFDSRVSLSVPQYLT